MVTAVEYLVTMLDVNCVIWRWCVDEVLQGWRFVLGYKGEPSWALFSWSYESLASIARLVPLSFHIAWFSNRCRNGWRWSMGFPPLCGQRLASPIIVNARDYVRSRFTIRVWLENIDRWRNQLINDDRCMDDIGGRVGTSKFWAGAPWRQSRAKLVIPIIDTVGDF